MPSVPSSTFQLAVLMVLLVPGIVYQFVRARLRGPAPDDHSALNRVLRALGVSGILALAYLLYFGDDVVQTLSLASAHVSQGVDPGVRGLAWWTVLLLFIVPAVLAIVLFYGPRLLRKAGVTWRLTYDPVPRAWDFAFWDRNPCFVRILTADGRYVGGWFGPGSFASSYPEPRELYLQDAFGLEKDGTFGQRIEGSAGIYIRCEDVVLVEFVDAPSEKTEDGT